MSGSLQELFAFKGQAILQKESRFKLVDELPIRRFRNRNHYEKSVWKNARLRFTAASPIIYIVMCVSLGKSCFIFEGELSHESQRERRAANSIVLTICVSHFFEVLVEKTVHARTGRLTDPA